MCCETTLSESEMLIQLAKQYGGDEVKAIAELLKWRNKDPGEAFYWHHLFVLGGRTSIVHLPDFYNARFGTSA